MRLIARALLPLIAVGVASSGSSALLAQQPSIPPEIAAHIPSNVQPYFVAFLVNPADPNAMPHELFVLHQAYIRKQLEAGVYHLAGPMTDEGHIRGMIILSAPDETAARAIVEGDPAVKEGIFAVETHPAVFPSLASLKIEYPPPN